MAWVKVSWINTMVTAFNAVAPNRRKDSDGTIGDTAHQSSPSGHNPDDTSGSLPEREDADSIAEVRAVDVTTALQQPGVTMEMIVQRILATPAERDRLIYIIFNRRIWRKSNGWRQETYPGSDPHDTHAHFSGDPNSDTDGGPWNSILSFGEANVAFFDDYNAKVMAYRVEQLQTGRDRSAVDGALAGETSWLVAQIKALVTGQAASATRETALAAAVQALATAIGDAGGDVDVAAINAHIDSKVSEVNAHVASLQDQLEQSAERESELRQRLSDAFDGDASAPTQ